MTGGYLYRMLLPVCIISVTVYVYMVKQSFCASCPYCESLLKEKSEMYNICHRMVIFQDTHQYQLVIPQTSCTCTCNWYRGQMGNMCFLRCVMAQSYCKSVFWGPLVGMVTNFCAVLCELLYSSHSIIAIMASSVAVSLQSVSDLHSQVP